MIIKNTGTQKFQRSSNFLTFMTFIWNWLHYTDFKYMNSKNTIVQLFQVRLENKLFLIYNIKVQCKRTNCINLFDIINSVILKSMSTGVETLIIIIFFSLAARASCNKR